MKRIAVTFSLPDNLNNQLRAFVEKRGLSKFVSKAIERALKDEKKSLKAAYIATKKDPDRQKLIEEWNSLDNKAWNDQA